MHTKGLKKIFAMYIITVIIPILFFLPIDILIFRDLNSDVIIRYLIINIIIISIIILLFNIGVILLNKNLKHREKKKVFIIKVIYILIISNIITFIFQNIFMRPININEYFSNIFQGKYFFISNVESIFILILLETIYYYNKYKQSELEKEKLKYTQLKNQLNPHFLFNSLSVSISLIKRNQDKAVKYTQKLSSVYRYVLINMENDIVSLEEEIEFIKKYIEILQIRYEDGLNVSYNIDEKLKKKRIIPLSLQLLIENAVKHNSIYSDNPLNVYIYTENNKIIVENNIIKKTTIIDSTGVGLKNLNQKYDILCSKDIEIINDSKNFVVKIPLL
ncbi:MAG: histidine kinase [Bacteroidetes bacterium]|nr:histidine kinase [Bacteroidota bacterium]